MNKEQLKQEAEEYFKNLDDCKTKELMIEAYLAGAEPREKRIEELEKEKSEIINLINDCLWSCVNKNFDKVEEGLKSLLNEYDE